MKRFKEQIILVSGQMIPNVTPVMDNRYRPARVTLCVTDRMQKRVKILEDYFRKQHIETEIFPVGNAWDYDKLQQRFMDLALDRWSTRNDVAVNLTGGTKLMTLAASQVLDSMYRFYVTDFNDILPVMPQKEMPERLQTVMKLQDFFAIHGYTVIGKKTELNIANSERELFDFLFCDPKANAQGIRKLNYLAAKGSEQQLTVKADIPEKIWPLLGKFRDAGKISSFDDRTITFPNEVARCYCSGIWLEDYLYLQLTRLDTRIGGLQDFACSLEIVGPDGAKNEIDAAFLYNNALYLVECKTANLYQDRATQILYKLDSIQDIPGMLTKTLLVSYLPVDSYDKKRAGELGIKIYDSALAKDLASQFAALLKKAEQ